jgi:hypothetical protein
MLLLRPPELASLLSLLLALLTVHGDEGESKARAEAIMSALSEDHDVPHGLSSGVMGLFGDLVGDDWNADVPAAVRELGRGLLTAQGVSLEALRKADNRPSPAPSTACWPTGAPRPVRLSPTLPSTSSAARTSSATPHRLRPTRASWSSTSPYTR